MLNYETIIPETKELLKKLMVQPEMKNFRLAGGTSLALQFGHRISDDLDFFIDGYDKFHKPEINKMIHRVFPNPAFLDKREFPFGMKLYYYFSEDKDQVIKIDIMNWDSEEFLKEPLQIDGLRLAAPEDIAAMKLNAIGDRFEKKDFIDIAELLKHFSLQDMMEYYSKKYPYNEKKSAVIALSKIDKADTSIMPKMFNEENWHTIKTGVKKHFRNYMHEQSRSQNSVNASKEILSRNNHNPKKNKGLSM